MDARAESAPPQRKLWVRALLMLLFSVAFQLAAWLLVVVAVVQLIVKVFAGEPNARLRSLGRSVGTYLAQIASFEVFDTEQAPFPFNDWPPVS